MLKKTGEREWEYERSNGYGAAELTGHERKKLGNDWS
jgi:hypothetical protein